MKKKIERIKQGPAENMTIAVLKQLFNGKGIAFSCFSATLVK